VGAAGGGDPARRGCLVAYGRWVAGRISSDRITVEGPLTLIDPSGNAVIVADFADLSADLRDGVLQSARLVLDRQLQIAATQIDRVDGRYSQAYQAVASSCEVCFDNPTPLWEIRARRIIHDEVEQQLYFEGAQFRVMGVPVIWLPQMRLPDPTLERATGFLAPSIRATDTTGTQIRVPYFIMLGDHADLTLTPWIGLGDSQTIELRYRQAFRTGEIEASGSLTWDNLTEDDIRGHIFADGTFDIGRNIDLSFRIMGVTDDGYLTTYSLPDTDLLESNIRIGRTERDRFFDVGISNLTSLREGDDNETLPTRVADGRFVHRFEPGALGGIAELRFDALGYFRPRATPGHRREQQAGGDGRRAYLGDTRLAPHGGAEQRAPPDLRGRACGRPAHRPAGRGPRRSTTPRRG
jgi:LPS-assembly protein